MEILPEVSLLRERSALVLALAALSIAAFSGCGESYHGYPVGVTTTSPPAASVSTGVLAFGAEPLGQTSSTQSVTLRNDGGNLAFSGVSVTGTNPGSFLASSACPSVLPNGASCTISVAFAPAASGALNATLLVSDSSANAPQMVSLSGTGTATGPVVSLSATSLTFTTLPVGQASTQTVTLTNIGVSALSLFGVTLAGANATSFATSGTCLTTATLAARNSCFLTVTYAPTVPGALSAVVNINDNAPNSPQTIALTSK